MGAQDVRLSKLLSLVLRHRPETIGITLDAAGWVDVDTLLEAMAAHGQPVTIEQLRSLVASSDKQRFALSDDGRRIRANQGHSVQVELGYEPAVPPERLYHGTTGRFVESIRTQGLVKGSRHHVHLSETPETAVIVGQRRGKPVVLTIQAGDMHRKGFTFYRTPNGVWLTDNVPAPYLVFATGEKR